MVEGLKKEYLLRGDDEDEVLGLNEGMAQLRGEAAKDQDKVQHHC